MGPALFYLKLWLNVDSEVTPRAKYYFYFCTYSKVGMGWGGYTAPLLTVL